MTIRLESIIFLGNGLWFVPDFFILNLVKKTSLSLMVYKTFSSQKYPFLYQIYQKNSATAVLSSISPSISFPSLFYKSYSHYIPSVPQFPLENFPHYSHSPRFSSGYTILGDNKNCCYQRRFMILS